jgi:hypothetical protein
MSETAETATQGGATLTDKPATPSRAVSKAPPPTNPATPAVEPKGHDVPTAAPNKVD